MEKLIYCDKRTGNSSCCSNLAVFKVNLNNGKYNFRCEKHKKSSTQNKKVISFVDINQTVNLYDVNEKLKKFIGKEFFSKFHKTELIGKYLKPNGSIMCANKYGRFKLVYYYQIEEIK